MPFKLTNGWLIAGGVLLLLVVFFSRSPASAPVVTPTPEIKAESSAEPSQAKVDTIEIKGTQATVARVIDGDTIELSTGEKVRYVGVDTPETLDPRKPVQCFGKEASAKNKELVEGKIVTLEKDVSETDKYGRLLRYIYVDGKMVNDLLVREGYAHSSSYPPDIKHQDQFRASEQAARTNKAGLWGSICSGQSAAPVATKTSTTITPKPVTQSAPIKTNVNCSANAYNCTDFSTCAEAMAVYDACPSDVNGLDRDQDGIPCDTLCQ